MPRPAVLVPAARLPRAAAAAALAGGALAGALLLGARRLRAQVVPVDEGSFAVSRAGAAVGREEFRIVRQPAAGGAAFVARAVAGYGPRRVSPALQADASGEPLRYQMDVRGAGPAERVSAEAGAAGHFAMTTQRGAREGARELLLPPGTVVADDEAYHQLFFLARQVLAGATLVHVLVPRTDAQLAVAVTRVGAEPVTVGGQALAATRFTLADARAGWRRDIWVDSEGRVLRVVVPGLAIDAVREDAPR